MKVKTEQAKSTLPSVALICDHPAQREVLRDILGAGGAHVAIAGALSEIELSGLKDKGVDCLLVNLEPDIADFSEQLERLLQVDVPVVFNEAEVSRQLGGWDQARWARHLIAKIRGISDVLPPPPAVSGGDPIQPAQAQAVRQVWVLGASIGGPEAVRTFLTQLPADMPVAFILAQHMGAEFLNLMATQLNRASELLVKCAEEGHPLQYGQVVIAPVGKRLTIDDDCRIRLLPIEQESPYSPSIDQVLIDVSERFAQRAGAIIFSGMARDGIEGAKFMAKNGGTIWAQSEETCVISSMVEGASEAGVVSEKATPSELADKLIEKFAAGGQ